MKETTDYIEGQKIEANASTLTRMNDHINVYFVAMLLAIHNVFDPTQNPYILDKKRFNTVILMINDLFDEKKYLIRELIGKWRRDYKRYIFKTAILNAIMNAKKFNKSYKHKRDSDELLGLSVVILKSFDNYLKGIDAELKRRFIQIYTDAVANNTLHDVLDEAIFQTKIVERRANMTLIQKLRSAFIQLACKKLSEIGIDKFIWKYSYLSKEPRPYHLNVLKDKVCSLKQPPLIDPETNEYGYPSQLPNCKCYMLPILYFQ